MNDAYFAAFFNYANQTESIARELARAHVRRIRRWLAAGDLPPELTSMVGLQEAAHVYRRFLASRGTPVDELPWPDGLRWIDLYWKGQETAIPDDLQILWVKKLYGRIGAGCMLCDPPRDPFKPRSLNSVTMPFHLPAARAVALGCRASRYVDHQSECRRPGDLYGRNRFELLWLDQPLFEPWGEIVRSWGATSGMLARSIERYEEQNYRDQLMLDEPSPSDETPWDNDFGSSSDGCSCGYMSESGPGAGYDCPVCGFA